MTLRMIDITAAADRYWLGDRDVRLESLSNLLSPWDAIQFQWRVPDEVVSDGERVPFGAPTLWKAHVERRATSWPPGRSCPCR